MIKAEAPLTRATESIQVPEMSLGSILSQEHLPTGVGLKGQPSEGACRAVSVIELTLGKDITEHIEVGGPLEDCRVKSLLEFEGERWHAKFRIVHADVLELGG